MADFPITISSVNILPDAITGSTTGARFSAGFSEKRTFQGTGVTSAGAGSATVIVEVSNDGTNWITMGTITLAFTTTLGTDGFTSDAPWRYLRARTTAIAGTDATVNVWMGG